eukprot:6217803-Amphidinium_carterae.1
MHRKDKWLALQHGELGTKTAPLTWGLHCSYRRPVLNYDVGRRLIKTDSSGTSGHKPSSQSGH